MNTMLSAAQLKLRCKLLCGAEAEALGLPSKMGEDVYAICTAENIFDWTRKDMTEAVERVKRKYSSSNRQSIFSLYVQVINLVIKYSDLLNQVNKLEETI